MAKRREIRNSTAEFLIFQIEGKGQGIEVFYKDKTVWCTQKAMGILFDCTSDNISVHLQNIYDTQELNKEATTEKISVVRREGNRDVNRTLQFYNLDAIISVGYRVNSIRATQFRQWATSVLREFAIRGYVLDRKRMENGTFLNEDYFEHLLAEIREIRLSERRFYQKLTDIYATAVDYNRDAPTTKLFFKMMQNKMHYAVHGRTAAELIVERADAKQEHMGLTSWENAPDGKIVKTDVSIAKNYLKEMELADMGQLVNGVLELAERMANRHIPMTMEELKRTRVGEYLLENATSIDNLKIISIMDAVNIKKIEVDNTLLKKISNGVRIDNIYNEDMVMFTYENKPVSIYVRDNNILKSYRVFNTNKNEL